MLCDMGAKGRVMGRKLRLATGPAGARRRLAGCPASAQGLVDVGNAHLEHWGSGISSHPAVNRRHYSLTQILGVRSSHGDPRCANQITHTESQNYGSGNPPILLNVNLL
jgi:hypothetical protein